MSLRITSPPQAKVQDSRHCHLFSEYFKGFMKIRSQRLTLALISAGLLSMYGCGGGGGSSDNASLATMSGVAATGTPLASGTVVVTDATGATVGTTTTGADGSYTLSFKPALFTAPYVIAATGSVGEASVSLVSVQPTSVSASATATVNITPITHAIAALLSSSGNPADLVTNIGTEKLNITTTKINAAEQGFRNAFAANMAAVGLTTSDNLLSGAFSAKFDKLLDNIHVEVAPSGEIQISSSAGAAVDDLGNTPTQPAAAKTVVLAKGTLPSSADLSNLPAPASPIGIDALEAARLALNACFAVPASTPRTITTAGCTNIAIAGYKHDGRNASAEFAGLLSDVGNDNMQFQKPEILRQLSTTSNSERVLVRLSATRTDGLIRQLTTVAANNYTASSGWQLVGNQRDYETFVNGFANKRMSANAPANNRYETGLNLYVGNSSDIASVQVTGPGLPPGGLTLKAKSGCDFLAIDDGSGTPPNCASLYRLRSLKTDGTAFTPSSSAYLFGSKTDAEIQTIIPMDLYKFVITQTSGAGGGTITYWNRLRSRPLTVAEMGLVKFVEFTPATVALMTNATLYAGGAAPTESWTVPTGGPKPYAAYFFHQNGSDRKGVSFNSNSATVPCSGNADCASGGAYNTGLTTTGAYLFQTVARNRFDTQIFTQLGK